MNEIDDDEEYDWTDDWFDDQLGCGCCSCCGCSCDDDWLNEVDIEYDLM